MITVEILDLVTCEETIYNHRCDDPAIAISRHVERRFGRSAFFFEDSTRNCHDRSLRYGRIARRVTASYSSLGQRVRVNVISKSNDQ